MSSVADSVQMAAKIDNRGAHWQAKVNAGNAPEPWKNTKVWSDEKKNVEEKFLALATSKGLAPPPFPWLMAGSRAIGNRNKALWMHLVACSWTEVVEMEMDHTLRGGFMGIKSIRVLKRDEFDSGLFPTVSGLKEDAKLKRKTLMKIWADAGFVEDKRGMRYDEATFQRMRAQALRAEEKRRAKNPQEASSAKPTQAIMPEPPAPTRASAPTSQDAAHFLEAMIQITRADAAKERVVRAEQQFAAALQELREAHAALGEASKKI